MVATEAAEGTRESGREALGLGWVLKEVRLLSICPSQNMATMKDTGKSLSHCSPTLKLYGK